MDETRQLAEVSTPALVQLSVERLEAMKANHEAFVDRLNSAIDALNSASVALSRVIESVDTTE